MSRRLREIIVAAFVVTTVVALAGCSGAPKAAGVTGGLDIAYLGYTPVADFAGSIEDGATSVVALDGGTVTYFSADNDSATQVTQCTKAVSGAKFEAIILASVDAKSGAACVAAARGAGIPVATVETTVGDDPYDLTPQVDGVVAVVGTPLQTQLDVEGQLLRRACKGIDPCNVISEIGSDKDRFTNDVADGIDTQYNPSIKIVERIVTQYDPTKLAAALPAALKEHPDAAVILTFADTSAVAAIPVVADAGLAGRVKILGMGGTTAGAKAVADGTLFATIGNWPRQYGEFLAKALDQAARGETVTNPSLDMLKVDTPALVTKSTVGSFRPEWNSGS